MLSLLNRDENMKILIVGAGLVGYGYAYSALNKGHEVHIADHSIEFGLPNVWPSILLDRKSIPLSFTTDQGFEGTDSSFRHEWIMKGMSIELAKLGAEFFHRTRVLSSRKSEDGMYSIDFKGAGQKTGMFEYNRVIDTTQDTWIPWATSHVLSDVSVRYDVGRREATGYVHLQSHMSHFNDAIYQIHRQDGLSESWYSGKHTSTNRKVIEIISTMLPTNHSLWDCSQRFQLGIDLESGTK